MFGLYVEVTACMSWCKITYFNIIYLHSLIRLKLSYMAEQDGAILHIYRRAAI